MPSRRARPALVGSALLLSLLIALAAAPPAWAQVVVHNNFGSGDTFDTSSGLTESGPSSVVGTISQGMGFTPTISGTLFDLTVAVSNAFGTNDAHLFLSDGTSGIPGTTLETFTLTNLPPFLSSFTPETLTSVLHPLLSAGTTYYLYEQETGDEDNAWNFNSTGENGVIQSFDNVNYSPFSNPAGAYRVRVTPTAVPEPSTLALLLCFGLSSSAFACPRLRRRPRLPA